MIILVIYREYNKYVAILSSSYGENIYEIYASEISSNWWPYNSNTTMVSYSFTASIFCVSYNFIVVIHVPKRKIYMTIYQ